MTAWLGVVSPLWIAAAALLFLAAAAIAFMASRKEQPTSSFGYPVAALTSCGIAITSALFGPFLYVPGLCTANVVVFAGTDRRLRWTALGGGVLAIVVPLALELMGIVPPILGFPRWRDHAPPASRAVPRRPYACAADGGRPDDLTTLPALLVGSERDGRAKAERELAIRAYQLAELLPGDTKIADGPGR